MEKRFLSNSSVLTKFVFSLFVIFVSFLVFMLVGFILGMIIFKINILETTAIFTDFSNPKNISILKFFQVIQSIGLFVAPPILIAWIFHKKIFTFLQLNSKPNFTTLIGSILVMIAAIPMINFLAEINSQLSLPHFMSGIEAWMKESEFTAQKITKAFLNVDGTSGLMINIFVIAVIPSIGEELLFRGVFQKLFIDRTKNIHTGIFLSAILFSAFHLQFYGFFPRMLMGIFFGYILVWSGSLWLPIAAHFTNNAVAVIFSYLVNIKAMDKNIESIGSSGEIAIPYTIASFILVSVFIFGIYKMEKQKVRTELQS